MAGDFELRTKYQFLGLIEKRDRWNALKNDPSAQHRFEHLVGLQWARHNCALDDRLELGLWQREALDEERVLQLARHMDAARWLLHHSHSQNSLSSSDLLEIHRLMLEGIDPNAGKYRETEIKPLGEGHEPTEPEMVPYVAENALEWFNSGSFHEMHEVEKTALVLIKFIDIWPFEEGNGRTLRLFSNFFLLKAGYPPAIIPPERAKQYAMAIQNSLRFHTQPLIDLLTDSVGQSLQYCLGEALAPPSLPVLQ
jgi:fido (protein-threonine AMPylation protein)